MPSNRSAEKAYVSRVGWSCGRRAVDGSGSRSTTGLPPRRHHQARNAARRHDRGLSSLHLSRQGVIEIPRLRRRHGGSARQGARRQGGIRPHRMAATHEGFRGRQFRHRDGGISITLDRQKKGLFSTPIMREGKTPIARCADAGKYESIADIDKAGTRVIVNPGGTNERFAKPTSGMPRSRPGTTTSRSSTRSPRAMRT
jgi:hypothetical protein